MSNNQLIIVNDKHQEIARHELTDRKHGGGLVVYAKEQKHDGQE